MSELRRYSPQKLDAPAPESDLGSLARFVVSYVDGASSPEEPVIATETGTKIPKVGDVFGLGDQIRTLDGRVEIRDDLGMVLRLGSKSEVSFEFEPALNRHVLSFFGSIYKTRLAQSRPITIQHCGKYRTSCYSCLCPFCIENTGEFSDTYYALEAAVPIFEYDEDGEWFLITEVPEGYRATLHYDTSKPMRDRYTVQEIVPISPFDYDRLTQDFLNPKYWH